MYAKKPKQSRSVETLRNMTDAAIGLIAAEGLSALTHRKIAQKAGVSLALTTYYFPKKADILVSVSKTVLERYRHRFDRALERYLRKDHVPQSMSEFTIRVIRITVDENREQALAWAEVFLDGLRNPDSAALVCESMQELQDVWGRIRDLIEPDFSDEALRSRIDLVVGLTYMGLGLDLRKRQVDDTFLRQRPAMEIWKPSKHIVQAAVPDQKKARQAPKEAKTRARILEAAIEVVTTEGMSALTHRKVAAMLGLAASAPSYHYPSISALLEDVQVALFEASKDRYREVAAEAGSQSWTFEQLSDTTAVILQREAMNFAQESLTLYQFWIEASRQPAIRLKVWDSIRSQAVAWDRVFEQVLGRPQHSLGILAVAQFAGKLVRIHYSSPQLSTLALVRKEFEADFKLIAAGKYLVKPEIEAVR